MADDKEKEDKTPPAADPKAEDKGGEDPELKGLPKEWHDKWNGLKKDISKKSEDLKTAKEEAKTAKEESAILRAAKEQEELDKKKKNGEWEEVAKKKESDLQKANERTMRAELKLIAQREGILDPSDVHTMPLDGLTMDEAGEVHGADKVIKGLKESKPHWFKTADTKKEDPKDPPPKPTGSSVPPPGKGLPAKEDLSGLTRAELDARWKDYVSGVRARS